MKGKYLKPVSQLSKDQWNNLLQMQDELNQQLHPTWATQGWQFGDAIVDEAMEVLDHMGWKWWKNSANYNQGITVSNVAQIKLELVDLLHFGLSIVMQAERNGGRPAEVQVAEGMEVLQAISVEMYKEDIDRILTSWDCCRAIIHQASSQEHHFAGSFDVTAWYILCCWAGLEADELYETYLAKYCLNKFRWEHGYKEGTYQKLWLIPDVSLEFKEDNWHLEVIMHRAQTEMREITPAYLMNALEAAYSKVTCQAGVTKH